MLVQKEQKLLDAEKYALFLVLIIVAAAFAFFALPPDAFAQPAVPGPRHPPGTCTSDPQFDIPYAVVTPGSGLISTIVSDIKNVLYATLWPMYVTILKSPSFTGTLRAGLTLYIAIYGIMFTFGMVQSTVYDFFSRMIKIGIIFWLLGGGASSVSAAQNTYWLQLLNYLWDFFVNGTDAVIYEVTRIVVGGISNPYVYTPTHIQTGGTITPGGATAPFAILDGVIATAVSTKMAVTILATFFTGPYGVLFGLLLLMCLGSFLKALFTAIWVYLMSLVLKVLLLALSPIFIAFLLFNRTRHLFDGWLNQLVNASLQPIFLFIFFGFFVALIQASMDNILKNPVCWTEWIDSVRGTPFAVHYWRFAIKDPSTGHWEPYGGLWSWEGAPGRNTPPFPIDIMHILIFLMLAELAGRFNNIIIMIASDIAGASTNLASMQGPLSEWMGAGGKNNSPVSAIGQRKTPGGVTGNTNATEGMRNFAQQLNNDGAIGTVTNQYRNLVGRRDT